MASLKQLVKSAPFNSLAHRAPAARKLASLALLTGVVFSMAACASEESTAELYNQNRGDRFYHTNLYDQPISGVHQYQRGRTARVEGSSPLTANVFLLDAEQKAAIDAMKRMREERKNAAF